MPSAPKVRLKRVPVPTSCLPNNPLEAWKVEALLVSQPHYRLRNGAWSGGGPFYVYNREVEHKGGSCGTMVRNDSVSNASCIGSFGAGTYQVQYRYPGSLSTAGVPLSSSALSGLSALSSTHSATGRARTRPGNAVASAGQFLIELRDLPTAPLRSAVSGLGLYPIQSVPRVLLKRLLDFRRLGSEYLNVQFGWKPFVSDVRKMYNLWYDIDKRMAQIVRENGKWIRRRAVLETDVSTSQLRAEYPYAYANVQCPHPNWAAGKTLCTSTRVTKKKVWYVAAYRYWIPDTSSSLWNARARLALFGALPTPELLWEVLPWSWLIDWFSNVGDIVSNASTNAVDNLVSKYSFVMEHTEETVELKSVTQHSAESVKNNTPIPGAPVVVKDWGGYDGSASSKQKTVTKKRVGGSNPFGLNVQLSSLSSYQLSILAALGLSRGLVR